MMTVVVKLFASYREAVGARQLSMELPDGTSVGQLLAALAERHPALRPLSGSATFAVNRRYVLPDERLADGDEVVLLPPIAGGAEPKWFEVTAEAVVPAVVAAKVEYPGAGAVVTFTGVVREQSNSGRAVTHLEYEAYPEMAEEQMAAIAEEIRARWGLGHVAMTHRVGRLAVGEVAVAIAVASPHRREGFEACQFAIDRLKAIVPIWKKEIGPDGAEWVE
jgi:molybdopterin synthase catalytic subunit